MLVANSAISVFRASGLNSLTTEKQTTKFLSANFQKMLSASYIILKFQDYRANCVDLDEVVHIMSHLIKICSVCKSQLFLSLVE